MTTFRDIIKYSSLLLCVFIFLSSFSGGSEGEFLKYYEDYYTFFVNDNYKVQNNVWGFSSGLKRSEYTQCVFSNTENPSCFGWEWKLNSKSLYPSYPRVEYGWNPWDENSTASDLPVRLDNTESVTVRFNKKFNGQGDYNTSFDLWITEDESPSDKEISAEIMIWIETTKIPDMERVEEKILINNEPYSLYINTSWNTFPLYIFIAKDEVWNGYIDLQPFLEYLTENYFLSDMNYLADIEFGNEIWSGSGCMVLEDYSIEIK